MNDGWSRGASAAVVAVKTRRGRRVPIKNHADCGPGFDTIASRANLTAQKGPAMKRSPMFFAAVVAAVFFSGCAEKGDKAIAYADGLGEDWTPAAPKQMRIACENYFTRDVVVQADAPGVHYEMTVGPIRKRYMIVPEAKYEIKAYTEERSTGLMHLYVNANDKNGAKGLHVKIRP